MIDQKYPRLFTLDSTIRYVIFAKAIFGLVLVVIVTSLFTLPTIADATAGRPLVAPRSWWFIVGMYLCSIGIAAFLIWFDVEQLRTRVTSLGILAPYFFGERFVPWASMSHFEVVEMTLLVHVGKRKLVIELVYYEDPEALIAFLQQHVTRLPVEMDEAPLHHGEGNVDDKAQSRNLPFVGLLIMVFMGIVIRGIVALLVSALVLSTVWLLGSWFPPSDVNIPTISYVIGISVAVEVGLGILGICSFLIGLLREEGGKGYRISASLGWYFALQVGRQGMISGGISGYYAVSAFALPDGFYPFGVLYGFIVGFVIERVARQLLARRLTIAHNARDEQAHNWYTGKE